MASHVWFLDFLNVVSHFLPDPDPGPETGMHYSSGSAKAKIKSSGSGSTIHSIRMDPDLHLGSNGQQFKKLN